MRKIIQKLLDNIDIDWSAFLRTIFAGIGIAFVIASLAAALVTINAWWLLMMLPAVVCIALSVAINPS